MKSKYLMIGAVACVALFLFSGIMLCRQYADEDFYRTHKIIHFDTLSNFGEYEIIAAFKTVAYSEQGFNYHFTRADLAEDFDAYIAHFLCMTPA